MKNFKIHYILSDYTIGLIFLFLPLYLKQELNFNHFQIGLLYMSGGLITLISSFSNSIIANIIKSSKKVLIYTNLSLFIGSIVLYNATNYQEVLIAYLFIFVIRNLLYILGDDITISYTQENETADYGKIRSYGSLGWGLNFLINIILFSINPKLLIIALLIVSLGLMLNSLLLPNLKSEIKRVSKKNVKELFLYKNYWIFLIVTVLMYSILNNMQMYIEFTIMETNGNLNIYALLNILIIAIDMMIIYNSRKILKKLQGKKYLTLYLTLIFLKFFFLTIFPHYKTVYLLTIVDPLIFGLSIPFVSLFVKTEVSQVIGGIALMILVESNTIMTSIMSGIYGYLSNSYGLRYVYLIMWLLITIALIVSKKINFEKINKLNKE